MWDMVEFLVSLRLKGLALVLFIQLMIWATDTGAYFVGRTFENGWPPAISPNKTVEGLIGGLLLAVISGLSSFKLLSTKTYSVIRSISL